MRNKKVKTNIAQNINKKKYKNRGKKSKDKSNKEKELTVLGIIGTIASGKDTLANFLVKNYGFKKITTSNFLRYEAEKKGIKCIRENLRKLQAQLRKEYGEDYIITKVIETILTKDHLRMKKIALVGLRTPVDVELAKKKLGAKIIFLDAKPEIRFLRQKQRARKGYDKNYDKFLQEDALEKATFEMHITRKLADFFIENNTEKEDLYKKAKKILTKLKIR